MDRLTGYIQVERVPNQCTSSAILGVKRWASKFGFPYKIISDRCGGIRDDFITHLERLGIIHKPSSAYHPLTERAVGSLKSVLRKSSDRLDELRLAEIAFAINSHVSQEGSDSNNDRFLGRSVRTRIPNSVNPQLNIEELIQKRIQNHENCIKGHNKMNKITFFPGIE